MTECVPVPDGDGQLTDARLTALPRAAATGDVNHDLASTLDVLNTDALGPDGHRQLIDADVRQIAHELRGAIDDRGQAGVWSGELAEIDAWSAPRRAPARQRAEAALALAGLSDEAVAWIESKTSAFCAELARRAAE